jgi:hypothetical protein
VDLAFLAKLNGVLRKLMDGYQLWLKKVSNDAHTDADHMDIVDPRQFEHLIELTLSLFDGALGNEIVDRAFSKLRIATELPSNRVK